MHFRTACVFIDGENLRHSLGDLFGSDFDPKDYLPKSAAWDKFFQALVHQADADHRLRTYWYVVDELDCYPYRLRQLMSRDAATGLIRDPVSLERVIRKHRPYDRELSGMSDLALRQKRIEEIGNLLITRETQIRGRFDGWQVLQDGIAHKFDAVEFRRTGSIWYDLRTNEFGQEKGVDVKLATDLLQLNDIYDVGIIVSGDADYVPAVQVVKDWGKHIVNVSFLKKSGGLLPGGARRLNKTTDRVIEVPYNDMAKFMNVVPKKAKSAVPGPSPSAPSPVPTPPVVAPTAPKTTP